MTDKVLLKKYVDDSGIKIVTICEKLGVTHPTWKRKSEGITEFTQNEIKVLCEILGINTKKEMISVFFTDKK